LNDATSIGSYVLVVNEKGAVERRNVKLGPTNDDQYVIEEGLTGNERVIAKGILKAIPGRMVTPELEAAAPESSSPASTGSGQSKGGK
jgi:multidrug efflux pump subunit AcrA (membrane-fusion protein)